MTKQNNLNKDTKHIMGTDGREKIAFYKTTQPAIFQRSLATMSIEGPKSDGSAFSVGTGNHFLTNAHIFPDQQTLLNSKIIFNYYDQDLNGSIFILELKGQTIYKVGNTNDDYCLFSIDDFDFRYSNIKRLFGGLALSNAQVSNLDVYMPQYPKGLDARLAIVQDKGGSKNCSIISYDAYDILVNCDAEEGASGSPVISRSSNQVVGLYYGESINGTAENYAIRSDYFLPYISTYIQNTNKEVLGVTYPIKAYVVDVSILQQTGTMGTYSNCYFDISNTVDSSITHNADSSTVVLKCKYDNTSLPIIDIAIKLWLTDSQNKKYPINSKNIVGTLTLNYFYENLQQTPARSWLLLKRLNSTNNTIIEEMVINLLNK